MTRQRKLVHCELTFRHSAIHGTLPAARGAAWHLNRSQAHGWDATARVPPRCNQVIATARQGQQQSGIPGDGAWASYQRGRSRKHKHSIACCFVNEEPKKRADGGIHGDMHSMVDGVNDQWDDRQPKQGWSPLLHQRRGCAALQAQLREVNLRCHNM